MDIRNQKYAPLILFYLIFCGIFKWKLLKQHIPKTLIMLLDCIFKFLISIYMAKKKVHFNLSVFLIVILHTFSKYAFLLCAENLSIVLLAILTPMRLIFTFLLCKIFQKKKYNFLEYIALILVLSGFIITSLKNKDHNIKVKTSKKYMLIILSLAGNFCNSFSVIIFDQKIRIKKIHFWNYMYIYSFLSLVTTVVEMIFEIFLSNYEFIIHLKNFSIYINTIFYVIESFMATILSFMLAPIQRGFFSVMIVVSVTIVSNFIYEHRPNLQNILAVILTYSGVGMFELKNIRKKKLKTQRLIATELPENSEN